jgi:hypothetical protein
MGIATTSAHDGILDEVVRAVRRMDETPRLVFERFGMRLVGVASNRRL